jgi:NitT/TauT family transport system substrate-binding protein
MPRIKRTWPFVAVLLAGAPAPGALRAEEIKIGVVAVAGLAAPYIAQERGYFAAEGVPATLVPFDSTATEAVATVSGDIDFGVAALAAAVYNLASQGELQIVAASAHEYPGFQIQGIFASGHAWAAGLKSLNDLPGHTFSVTGMSGPPVYVVGSLVAAKYGYDVKDIQFVPVETIPNVATSIIGGRVDATGTSLTAALVPVVERGDVKLLAWVGDETPWQYGGVMASTKTVKERPDVVARFLRAYRRATRDYHDAVAGPDEQRRDGPSTEAVLALVAKSTHQTVDQLKLAVPYVDADARLDVKDVLRQIAWYRSQGLVKGPVEAEAMIDTRDVIPLPDR